MLEHDLPVEALVPLAVREGNRKKPIYEIHKWWARRLGSNFRALLLSSLLPNNKGRRELWQEFYAKHNWKNLVVFDPFMGGGTSIVEATKLGAKTIGNDIDPVAWFVTKKEIEEVDIQSLRAAFERIERDVAAELKAFYKHKLPTGDTADVTTYFWVLTLPCPACSKELEAHPHYQLYDDSDNKRQAVFCRACHEIQWIASRRKNFECKSCHSQTSIFEGTVRTGNIACDCGFEGRLVDQAKPGKPLSAKMFALEYVFPSKDGRDFARVTGDDLRLYGEACKALELQGESLPYPRDSIPTEDRNDYRPLTYGYTTYQELFNRRQLLCLSKILREIRKIENASTREYLLLAFSDALASNNMLCSYAFGYRKLTPLFGLHAYRIVQRPVEGNVWGTKFGRGSFTKCFEKLVRGKEYCSEPYECKGDAREKHYTKEQFGVRTTLDAAEFYSDRAQSLLLNGDSARLPQIKDGSVDLILTDPPYYNNLSYSEMADFYYVWIKNDLPSPDKRWSGPSTPYKEGLFVRRRTVEEHLKFSQGMGTVLKECRRVLRADGMMVFTYHHSDRRAWMVLGQALFSAGFEITNVLPILSEGRSGFHSDEGNIKWDAVLVCRPRATYPTMHEPEPEQVASFAKRKVRVWKKRLKKVKPGLSKADSASLAFAFGLWRLSRGPTDGRSITDCLNEVAESVNKAKHTMWLFKPTTKNLRASGEKILTELRAKRSAAR